MLTTIYYIVSCIMVVLILVHCLTPVHCLIIPATFRTWGFNHQILHNVRTGVCINTADQSCDNSAGGVLLLTVLAVLAVLTVVDVLAVLTVVAILTVYLLYSHCTHTVLTVVAVLAVLAVLTLPSLYSHCTHCTISIMQARRAEG
jgi:hypothetical protein